MRRVQILLITYLLGTVYIKEVTIKLKLLLKNINKAGKNMRNLWRVNLFISIILSLAIAFLITGCAENAGNASAQKALELKDLSFTEVGSGKSIHLGMTKDEVEKIFGPGLEYLNTSNYGEFGVLYKDNKVIVIIMGPSKNSSEKACVFNGDIKLGDNKLDLIERYGSPAKAANGSPVKNPIDFLFKLDGDKLIKADIFPDYSKESSEVYIDISMSFDKNENDGERKLNAITLSNLNEFRKAGAFSKD